MEARLYARDNSMCESDGVSAMSAIRELTFAPEGGGRLPLPDQCSLDLSCFEEPEVQDALALAIEEILYVVTFSGIELQALDGVTVTSDCRAAACTLQDLPQGQVPLEMNSQPEVMEMARTAAVRREGDLRSISCCVAVWRCRHFLGSRRCSGWRWAASPTKPRMWNMRAICTGCFPTLAQRKGTVKDVQGVMRHTRVATTTDIYMQEIAEGVRATVDSIHDELDGTMKKLAGKVGPQTATTGSALVN